MFELRKLNRVATMDIKDGTAPLNILLKFNAEESYKFHYILRIYTITNK